MKKIFTGQSPLGFLGFRHASAESQEMPSYLSGYKPVKRMHKAASVGDITQVQRMLIFEDVDVNITDRKKRTALHDASAHGQPEMVSLLLWYECNIDVCDRDKSTALIKATQCQHEKCVHILLENGADTNATYADQNTALHYAVHNNTSIAAELLGHNADTKVKAKGGYTPLILAVLENKQEIAELLLKKEVDINALYHCNRSALIRAVRAQSKNMISLLLQQGANDSLVDVFGATAQSYSVFESFKVLSNSPGPRCPEPTIKGDAYDFDTKNACTPRSCPIKESKQQIAELPAKEKAKAHAEETLGRCKW
uniref:Uncharacterized protein n=1 Tax=Nannospalax galili TaxID=1026970 RepID=A0A8C6R611_NANGA